jgi:hypothetical protein
VIDGAIDGCDDAPLCIRAQGGQEPILALDGADAGVEVHLTQLQVPVVRAEAIRCGSVGRKDLLGEAQDTAVLD